MHICMHATKHKAQHHPLFVCSLYSPIKFFIILLIPVLLVLESSLVFFSTEIFEYLKWSRSKHQSKCNQSIQRLFKKRNEMQSGN